MDGSPPPPVVRSWLRIQETTPGSKVPETLPIQQQGTTYTMAQELKWLDMEHFAVGRWDGSMSIFRFNQAPQEGPLISKVVNTPSAEGVQMIAWLAPGVFATSNDEQTVLVWHATDSGWTDLAPSQVLQFDSSLGVANSGTAYVTPDGTTLYFLVGHASGYVTLWKGAPDGTELSLIQTIDIRSANPVNPWGIHNVRGTAMIWWDSDYGYAVTGSEDGDLCVIRVPDGAILSRTVYNPSAQRGINSISTLGQNLLVANCAVGPADFNLWYFWIDSSDWSVQLRDSANLKVDASRPQVFNFDVVWGYYTGGVCWFSVTEEGYLWMGTIQNDQSLSVVGCQKVTGNLGAALEMAGNGNLACAAYDLYEFNTTPGTVPLTDRDPARFAPAG